MSALSTLTDRELDARVAEVVMGLGVTPNVVCMFECGSAVDYGLTATKGESLREEVWYDPVPSYSTDGNAMLEVLARLEELDIEYVLDNNANTKTAMLTKDGEWWGVDAATLPRAVAEAAVAAMEAR